ncbi:hypothetical protein [Demequina maris]|uniref:hypothetical protein n=1 Tax=Demequina maris TaxID=1638982 RepID=UPI00078332C9|nr:hypothetical protein [Demequina maris]
MTITILPADHLACLACGIAAMPGTTETFISIGRLAQPGRPRMAANERSEYFELTRCPGCEQTRQQAAALVAEHPVVAHRLGTAAVERLEAGLGVLRLLGARTPRLTSARDVLRFVDHMSTAGALVRWSRRYTPVALSDAQDEDCNEAPWEHATEADRQTARDALAGLLAAVNERPAPIPCPDPSGGCMLCGIASVEALPSRAAHAWTPATANPSPLGGRPSNKRLSGHLCPTCATACDTVGSIGPTAMERALMAALGVRRKSLTPTELVGLKAWAVMPEASPNRRPWGHIEHVEALRTVLA